MERYLKSSDWISVILCLFAVFGYGVYLLQLFIYSLNIASNYNQFMNLSQVLESLYAFGKFGVIGFAVVESVMLLNYLRFKVVGFTRLIIYSLIFITISNLLVYLFISYLYGYAIAIIQ